MKYLKLLFIAPLFLLMGAGQNPGPAVTGANVASGGGGYTDNFSGTSLSDNWTCYVTGLWVVPSVSSNQVYNKQGGGSNWTSMCGYTGGTFVTSQRSQFTDSSVGVAINNSGPCVNMNPASGNGYCAPTDGGFIGKFTAGSYTSIGSYYSSAPATGDIVRLTNTSGTIILFDVTTSTTMNTATDSTYTGGVPGFIFAYGNQYSKTSVISAWSGQ